jgi:hypothetical protein
MTVYEWPDAAGYRISAPKRQLMDDVHETRYDGGRVVTFLNDGIPMRKIRCKIVLSKPQREIFRTFYEETLRGKLNAFHCPVLDLNCSMTFWRIKNEVDIPMYGKSCTLDLELEEAFA